MTALTGGFFMPEISASVAGVLPKTEGKNQSSDTNRDTARLLLFLVV
ncbi:MAG: hypothetical protein PHR16_13285 [Methylovulum sp.]|nr:hypothetical protein [Methylovulum sp.]